MAVAFALKIKDALNFSDTTQAQLRELSKIFNKDESASVRAPLPPLPALSTLAHHPRARSPQTARPAVVNALLEINGGGSGR